MIAAVLRGGPFDGCDRDVADAAPERLVLVEWSDWTPPDSPWPIARQLHRYDLAGQCPLTGRIVYSYTGPHHVRPAGSPPSPKEINR